MADLTLDPKGYQDLLALLTTRIRTTQLRASIAVNQELIVRYWGTAGDSAPARRRLGNEGDRVAGK